MTCGLLCDIIGSCSSIAKGEFSRECGSNFDSSGWQNMSLFVDLVRRLGYVKDGHDCSSSQVLVGYRRQCRFGCEARVLDCLPHSRTSIMSVLDTMTLLKILISNSTANFLLVFFDSDCIHIIFAISLTPTVSIIRWE